MEIIDCQLEYLLNKARDVVASGTSFMSVFLSFFISSTYIVSTLDTLDTLDTAFYRLQFCSCRFNLRFVNCTACC